MRLQLGWRALWAADSFGRVSTGTFLHDGLHVYYICMTFGRLAIRLCRRGLVVFRATANVEKHNEDGVVFPSPFVIQNNPDLSEAQCEHCPPRHMD